MNYGFRSFSILAFFCFCLRVSCLAQSPVWPIATNSDNPQIVDFRSAQPVVSDLPTATPSLAGGSAAGYGECGVLSFYALHNGTGDPDGLEIFAPDGSLLYSGFNGVKGDREVQVIKVPGTVNEWFLIYNEWSTDVGALINNGSYTPSRLLYSHFRINGGTLTVLAKDVVLTDGNGTDHTYTLGKAVSASGFDGYDHFLYGVRRSENVNTLSVDRFGIDANGITWVKNTGDVPAQWWYLTITGSEVEVSPSGNRLAVVNRNESYNWEDMMVFDLSTFNNVDYHGISAGNLILQPDANLLTTPERVTDAANNVPELSFLRNMERKISSIEFSPGGRFLYFAGGGYVSSGYSNLTYLGQIDIGKEFNASQNDLNLRLQIQTTVDDVYDANGRGCANSACRDRRPNITALQSAIDGNLYFCKFADSTLYVIPGPDNFMPHNLVPYYVDLSSTRTPNIQLNGQVVILPEHIDGFNYRVSANNTVDVDFAISPDTGCAPLEVSFQNTTGASEMACTWTFGEDSVSTQCDTVYTWEHGGEFPIRLALSDNQGCEYYKVDTLVVHPEHSINVDFSDTIVCHDSPPLQVGLQFVGMPAFSIQIDSVGQKEMITGLGTRHTLNLLPDDSTYYHIIYSEDANGCGDSADVGFFIKIQDTVLLDSVVARCLDNNQGYVVTAYTQGGSTLYSTSDINGSPAGSWSGPDWVSDTLNRNDPFWFSLALLDDPPCPTIIQGNSPCPACVTDAGQINTPAAVLCDNQPASVIFSQNPTTDANDTIQFILYENDIQNPVAKNNTGVFSFDPSTMTHGTQYTIVAVAGNHAGLGAVDQSDACLDYSSEITVQWIVSPSVTVQYNSPVCPGQAVNLQYSFSGIQSTYDMVYSPGIRLNGLSTPYNSTLSPSADTSFTIDSVYYGNDPFCGARVNELISIQVNQPPDTANFSILCDTDRQNYRVQFNLTGGDPASYTVNGTPTGSSYTSGWISSGTPYNFVLSDGSGCSRTISATYSCPCITDAGTLDPMAIEVCENMFAQVIHNRDETLDGNDILEFVLHTGNATTIGQILDRNTTGKFFYNPDWNYNTPYFVTAVAGLNQGGQVNMNGSCVDRSSGVQVIFRRIPSLNIKAVNDSICPGEQAVLIFSANGVPPYTVQMDDGTGSQTITVSRNTDTLYFDTPADTTYTFTSIADAHCSATVNIPVSIAVSPALTVDFQADTLEGCTPFNIAFENTSNGNYSECRWWLNGTVISDQCGQWTHTFTTEGEHKVWLELSNAYGCSFSGPDTALIFSAPGPIADFEFTEPDMHILHPKTGVENHSVNSTRFEWFIDDQFVTWDQNPTFTFPPDSVNNYYICLVAEGELECRDTVCKFLEVKDRLFVYVPNTFTPNDDGINEVFFPSISNLNGIAELEFLIFNRWGELIFESNAIENAVWDGRYKQQLVPLGVYNWILRLRPVGDVESRRWYGSVRVIR